MPQERIARLETCARPGFLQRMGDAPRATFMRTSVKPLEITGLGHCGIGDRPDERRSREIAGDEHDTIRQRHYQQAVQGYKLRDATHPTRG